MSHLAPPRRWYVKPGELIMRLRKLLLAASAIAVAGVMAIAPSAMAANTHVDVAGQPNGTYPISLGFTSASVTIAVYGFPTTITCTGGSASGTVTDNVGLATAANSATISSLSLTCPSIFPGTTVTMSATCNIPFVANSGFTAGASDTAVVGQTNFTTAGTDCVGVSISNGCTFTVGGSPVATFNESAQSLTLSGNAPTIHNVSGCLGAVSNNQTFTLNAAFSVSGSGAINITS
jgi:hypothetical protein